MSTEKSLCDPLIVFGHNHSGNVKQKIQYSSAANGLFVDAAVKSVNNNGFCTVNTTK